jgi:hypothetical protein
VRRDAAVSLLGWGARGHQVGVDVEHVHGPGTADVLRIRAPGNRRAGIASGGPRQPWQGPRREATLERLLTDENAARGSLGAACPAVLLPGALSPQETV